MSSTMQEALANCRFYVEIDGINQAIFTEVGGLQVETTLQEYEEGGNNGFVHRLPGRTKVGNLTLKRGMTASNELFLWLMQVTQGNIKRKNVSVVLYDTTGTAILRWNFQNAYPVKWTGPQFTAANAVMAIETIELTHEGLKPG